jgi:hypothetical protein
MRYHLYASVCASLVVDAMLDPAGFITFAEKKAVPNGEEHG